MIIMDEDFEILYDDDVIDFPDDLPEIEEIHQGENGQTTPTMNTSPIFENDPNMSRSPVITTTTYNL